MGRANELEVVVGDDGSLTVSAHELARHGVGPGAHLRLVAEGRGENRSRSMRGVLASVASSDAVRAWSEALDDDRIERRGRLGSIDE